MEGALPLAFTVNVDVVVGSEEVPVLVLLEGAITVAVTETVDVEVGTEEVLELVLVPVLLEEAMKVDVTEAVDVAVLPIVGESLPGWSERVQRPQENGWLIQLPGRRVQVL